MKNSSTIVFVILVLCLVALALLISQVVTAPSDGQTEFEDNVNYTELPKSFPIDSSASRDDQPLTADAGSSREQQFRDLVPATAADSSIASSAGDAEGRYLVIAGTFRQVINARTRVRDLVQAGFAETELKIFDRGTYAVALVDRSNSYTEAAELAGRVRSAGFEADVYRQR
ncbi:SPOR domain-containing protein [Neolewinella litorea]|uniref:SPOR domain-containing protein n=1 Tax=Neolewinella litorea TaxID=2562452 RepID=A0A4S4NHQ4_9BACT|nr:SPOR domain-containing protein [Neolewinella litorea]THH37738.1 SPOR domain-containing protein [Neolewinella litorea]